MQQIILADEQAGILARAAGPVTVKDSQGNVVGHFEPAFTPDVIAERKLRAGSPGPFFSGDRVQARLRPLQQELDRTGGFDKACMEAYLNQLDLADAGHMRSKGPPE